MAAIAVGFVVDGDVLFSEETAAEGVIKIEFDEHQAFPR